LAFILLLSVYSGIFQVALGPVEASINITTGDVQESRNQIKELGIIGLVWLSSEIVLDFKRNILECYNCPNILNEVDDLEGPSKHSLLSIGFNKISSLQSISIPSLETQKNAKVVECQKIHYLVRSGFQNVERSLYISMVEEPPQSLTTQGLHAAHIQHSIMP
jgi:hypothetical protein